MNPPIDTLTPEFVFTALGSILDPEFGVGIVDLGLIYDVQLSDSQVTAVMTLTSLYCPAGDVIMDGVRSVLTSIGGGRAVDVQLVWSPPWTPERLTPAACEQLGWRKGDET